MEITHMMILCDLTPLSVLHSAIVVPKEGAFRNTSPPPHSTVTCRPQPAFGSYTEGQVKPMVLQQYADNKSTSYVNGPDNM